MPHELPLAADRSQGPVTGILERPAGAFALCVLAHGAGADMRHRFMQAIADELAAVGVATLRFNFPYTERAGRRPDPHRSARRTCVRSAPTPRASRPSCRSSRAGSRSAGG